MSELRKGQWGIYRGSPDSDPALVRYLNSEREGDYYIQYKFKRGNRVDDGSVGRSQTRWFDNDPGNDWDAAWDLFIGDEWK